MRAWGRVGRRGGEGGGGGVSGSGWEYGRGSHASSREEKGYWVRPESRWGWGKQRGMMVNRIACWGPVETPGGAVIDTMQFFYLAFRTANTHRARERGLRHNGG